MKKIFIKKIVLLFCCFGFIGLNAQEWYEIETDNGLMLLGGDQPGKTIIETDNPIFEFTEKVYLKLDEAGDYSYGLLVNTNRDKTKAIAVKDDAGTTVFTVWGSGVINARKLYAEEVEVRPDVYGKWWPDYVFKKDYDLMTIAELEEYIERNGNLPNVPNEDQIHEEGVKLAEMSGILLRKIEELTLYIIEQEKKMKKIEEELMMIKKMK